MVFEEQKSPKSMVHFSYEELKKKLTKNYVVQFLGSWRKQSKEIRNQSQIRCWISWSSQRNKHKNGLLSVSNTATFLEGIVLEEMLTWSAQAVEQRCLKHLNALRAFSGSSWGASKSNHCLVEFLVENGLPVNGIAYPKLHKLCSSLFVFYPMFWVKHS